MNQFKSDRVRKNTSEQVNHQIDKTLKKHLQKAISDKEYLDIRLSKINKEWDIERWLETNASIIALIGIILAYFIHIYWLILPVIVLLFLFQHAVQGWCPPLPIFRRFNVRTQKEIDREIYSLKLIRGDFHNINYENTDDLLSAIIK